jgi:dipeptidyl aminopeptidase/acylaminoacyl peptidase
MKGLGQLGLVAGLFLFASISTSGQDEGPGFDPAPVQIPTKAKAPLRAITSMDLLSIRDLHGLSISPDGNYVAFVVGQAVYGTNSYRSGIFVMATKPGSVAVSLGSAGLPQWDQINQWVEEAPQWSPDGKYIMHRMRMAATEKWQVWRWSRDGAEPVQVTHISGNVKSYDITPDGTKILLGVEQPPDLTDAQKLAAEGILYDGSFFTSRSRSVVSEVLATKPPRTETWIHEVPTAKERKATQEEIELFGPWVSDLDEKVLNRLNPVLEGHHVIDAKVSPDRRLVAYRYLPKEPTESRGGLYLLFVKPVRRGDPIQLQMPPDAYVVSDYWWSGDSSGLYYRQVEADGHGAKLMMISINGGSAKQVFGSPDFLSHWSINQSARYMVSGRENPTAPEQIVLVDLTDGSIRELIDLNPEFEDIQLSKPVRVDGVNKFGDGWYAQIVKPLNYESSKRYPTILTTYRSADYFLRGASGDENPIQVYAARGFAVISFDMGRDRYSRLSPAGNFQDFLVAEASPIASMEMAIQKGVEMGIVDPGKVGVTGYSRGTEQVAYAITHTSLFQVATGAAGDTSPYSYYMFPDFIKRHFASQYGLGGWPEGESRSKWKEIAPELNADRIHVPVLNNTPDSEFLCDLALYTSLKELGKPVDLFIYPNELHHVNQPKHRYQIYERNLDWFLFWLKSEESPEPKKKEQYQRWHHLRQLQQQAKATAKDASRQGALQ